MKVLSNDRCIPMVPMFTEPPESSKALLAELVGPRLVRPMLLGRR
jgi:hypothetical protein